MLLRLSVLFASYPRDQGHADTRIYCEIGGFHFTQVSLIITQVKNKCGLCLDFSLSVC